VKYEPGVLKVVAYKNGNKWAEDLVETTGAVTKLEANADQNTIKSDGKDLSFITVKVADNKNRLVPGSDNQIRFKIEGPGEMSTIRKQPVKLCLT